MVGRSRVATISGAGPAGEGFSFESYRFPGKSSDKQPIAALSYTSHGFNGTPSPTAAPHFNSNYPKSRIFPISRSPSYERAIISSLKNSDPGARKKLKGSSFPQFALTDSSGYRERLDEHKVSSKPVRTESNSSTQQPESVTTLTSLASSESSAENYHGSPAKMKTADPVVLEVNSPGSDRKNVWPLTLSPESLLTECDGSSQMDSSLPPYSLNSTVQLGGDSPAAPTPLRRRATILPNGDISESSHLPLQCCSATQTIISIPNFTSSDNAGEPGNHFCKFSYWLFFLPIYFSVFMQYLIGIIFA